VEEAKEPGEYDDMDMNAAIDKMSSKAKANEKDSDSDF